MSNRSVQIHNFEPENFPRIVVATYSQLRGVSMHHDTNWKKNYLIGKNAWEMSRQSDANGNEFYLWRSNGRHASMSAPLFCPNRFKCRPRLFVAGSSFSEVVLLNCSDKFCRNEPVNEKLEIPLESDCWDGVDLLDAIYRLICCHHASIDWTFRAWYPVNRG